MPLPISEFQDLIRQQGLAATVSTLVRRLPPSLLQLVKYGFFGVCSVCIYQSIFGVLGHSFLPHFDDLSGLSAGARKVNFILSSAIGFFCANGFAYLTNVRWVFQSGRHDRWTEFFLFSGVSFLGWVVGMVPGYLAFDDGHASSWVASAVVTVVSVVVNFICRKVFIFLP
ncbi:MAG: GtrA family protein [Verrucomicrobia bacterium]|nr:GtrA family protein [Verrucomicrobiota bacterium]